MKNECRGEADGTLWWETLQGLGLSTWEAKCHGCREQVFLLISAQNPALSWQCANNGSGIIRGCLLDMSTGEWATDALNFSISGSSSGNVKGSGQWSGAADAEEEALSRSRVVIDLWTPERCGVNITPFQRHHSHFTQCESQLYFREWHSPRIQCQLYPQELGNVAT